MSSLCTQRQVLIQESRNNPEENPNSIEKKIQNLDFFLPEAHF